MDKELMDEKTREAYEQSKKIVFAALGFAALVIVALILIIATFK